MPFLSSSQERRPRIREVSWIYQVDQQLKLDWVWISRRQKKSTHAIKQKAPHPTLQNGAIRPQAAAFWRTARNLNFVPKTTVTLRTSRAWRSIKRDNETLLLQISRHSLQYIRLDWSFHIAQSLYGLSCWTPSMNTHTWSKLNKWNTHLSRQALSRIVL